MVCLKTECLSKVKPPLRDKRGENFRLKPNSCSAPILAQEQDASISQVVILYKYFMILLSVGATQRFY